MSLSAEEGAKSDLSMPGSEANLLLYSDVNSGRNAFASSMVFIPLAQSSETSLDCRVPQSLSILPLAWDADVVMSSMPSWSHILLNRAWVSLSIALSFSESPLNSKTVRLSS